MLVILLVLGVGSWYLLTQKEETNSSIKLTERNFKLVGAEKDELSKIVIKDRQLGNSEFIKKGDKWYIDGDKLASKYAMGPLLQAIYTVEIDFIPHQNAKEPIIKEMGTIGIQVELFDKDNELMRSYYVGGGTALERGCYYLMKGSTQPYVVKMPNIEGSTRNRFIINKNEFRDRSIITAASEDIVSIQVDYPREQNASFKLYDIDTKPLVEPLYGLKNKTSRVARKAAVESYMNSFTKNGAEYIDNDNPKRDSITAQLPFAIIKYGLKNGEEKTIQLFPLTDILEEGEDLPKLEMLVKIERYFADCSWGDFLLVQQRVIGKWLRPYDFFIEE